MSLTLAATLAAVGLFLGMLVFFEVGRRIGVSRRASQPDGLLEGSGTVDSMGQILVQLRDSMR